MSDLVTCADVARYIGVSIADTTVKAKIDAMVTQVSAAVERHCDRVFSEVTYKHWFDGNGTRVLRLNQYPVTRVYQMSSSTQDLIRLSYTGSAPEAFTSCDGVTLTLTATTPVDITLASYATATLLKAEIETNTGWSASIYNGMDAFDTTKIKPFSGYVKGAGDELNLVIPEDASEARMSEGSEFLLEGCFPCGYLNIFVWYKAGYPAGSIPADLQMVVTRIVADVYASSSRAPGMREEKLGDYSYKLGGDINSTVENYAAALSEFKLKVFA